MRYLVAWCALAACAGAAPRLGAQVPSLGTHFRGYLRALDGALERARGRVGQIDIWEDHSTWEAAWVVRTDDFAVRTTHSYGLGKNIADGLQWILGQIHATLETDFVPSEPLPVYLLPDVAAYNTLGANYDEHSSYYGSFYANQEAERPVAVVYNDNLTMLRMYTTHSVVHQYLAAAYPGSTPPTWVSEGLAAYFSIHWDYYWALDEWEQMRDEDEMIPLRSLLNDPIAAYSNSHDRFIQLGMLFYYLLRYREDTRTALPNEPVQQSPFRDYLLSAIDGELDTDSRVHGLLTQPGVLEKTLETYRFPR